MDTDTDTTLWYRFQIDPYCWYTHNLIALREAVLSWKAEICDQENHPPATPTACMLMCSGYNNIDLHGAFQGSVLLWNVLILLEYIGLLWFVKPYFWMLVSIRISFWVCHFDISYQLSVVSVSGSYEWDQNITYGTTMLSCGNLLHTLIWLQWSPFFLKLFKET